jgi:gluconolactonase
MKHPRNSLVTLLLLFAGPLEAGLVPAIPDHVMAAPGDGEVRLSWRPAARALAYNLKVGTAATGPFSLVMTGWVAATFTHSNSANGQSYHYVVSAINEYGESANSAVLSVMPSAPVLDLLSAGAKVERLASGFQFIEGPVWIPEEEGYLVFSDINANRLIRWSPRTGSTTFRQPSGQANGNTIDAAGRLVTCEHANRRVSRTEADGTIVSLVDQYRGIPFNAPNDVAVKSDGTIWFTDPNYGLGQMQPGRYVFRFHPSNGNATVTALVTNFDQPNGICFSPDETRIYIADSGGPRHVRVFDVLPDNALTNGRVFTTINPGAPDGMRTDAAGRLFSSAGDGVQIFSPAGALLGRILTPETPANLCFGGPDNRMLFITARTSLYGVTGLPDLIVSSIRRYPSSPRPGQGVLFNVTVKNQGSGPTAADVALRVAISVGTNENIIWSESFTQALPPDASVILTCDAGVYGPSWTATPGGHTARATVDDVDRIFESNETNNFLTTNIAVPNAADTDGDGLDDGSEGVAGTDPLDPASVPRISASERMGTNGLRLTWETVPGRRYRVVGKGTFAELVWVDLSESITASNTTMSWSTELPSASAAALLKVFVTR